MIGCYEFVRHMPSRRVLTNGWVFWLAHHQKHGLILFDRTDQDDVPAGSLRVFEARKSSRFILPQEELKSETSDDVSDSEFVEIVTLYNGVKVLTRQSNRFITRHIGFSGAENRT